jgi:hypothetical protein
VVQVEPGTSVLAQVEAAAGLQEQSDWAKSAARAAALAVAAAAGPMVVRLSGARLVAQMAAMAAEGLVDLAGVLAA